MNHRFWNDCELSGYLTDMHREYNLIDIYHRNGQVRELWKVLEQIGFAKDKAQFRMLALERQFKKEREAQVLEDPFGYVAEQKQQRCYWRRVGFSIFLAIAVVVVLVPMLTSCATTSTEPETKICYLQVIGKTSEGYTVVAQQCLTPEAFAESQK